MAEYFGYDRDQVYLRSGSWLTKGSFYSESAIRFSNLQNKIFRIAILSLKFEFVIGGKCKFQVQDSFLEYFYFGDWKI